jgi:hypothetical protein
MTIKAAAEQRKKLAILFTAEGLSQRKTATALNASGRQIGRDLNAANAAPGGENAEESKAAKAASAANAAPSLPPGGASANSAVKRREPLQILKKSLRRTCPTPG